MGYYLLTGATGLLGRYLLRHLLMSDVPVAVVVRGNRIANAWQRTESVVGELEETLGRTLPRPIVLEGELTQPELGLSRETLNWVKRHCRAVLHNAASLSFQKGEPHEEPWISNVTGTQRVLELTEMCGIREFHHVSTAYVCGQRRGKVYESELDLGQEFGNDYEASKLTAEKMVRSAQWLDAPTIYRPAIIVGDSRTSFTNTFHGFYTPLQIVYSMMMRVNPTDLNPQSLIEALGLAGDERKNLVPVDWIAAAIATLLREPRNHGEVYHLTPRNTTPVSTLCDVFSQATQQFAVTNARSSNSAGGGPSIASLAQMFRSQMTVYQAYWRDDPEFDRTNIEARLPELPCPV
ncbi:MAG TPA: SDR family oxidoreductase, partial [Pirellulaceae bacterium]|nr:SDR family oxidoreductase [Pirellulaceae bacterium]